MVRARLFSRISAAPARGDLEKWRAVGSSDDAGADIRGISLSGLLTVHSQQRDRVLARGIYNFGVDGRGAHPQSRLEIGRRGRDRWVRTRRVSSLAPDRRPLDADWSARRMELERDVFLRCAQRRI